MFGTILFIAFICLIIFLAGPFIIEVFQNSMEEWKEVLKINKEDSDA